MNCRDDSVRNQRCQIQRVLKGCFRHLMLYTPLVPINFSAKKKFIQPKIVDSFAAFEIDLLICHLLRFESSQ